MEINDRGKNKIAQMRPQGSKETNSQCGSFYRITDPIIASQGYEIKMTEGVFKIKGE